MTAFRVMKQRHMLWSHRTSHPVFDRYLASLTDADVTRSPFVLLAESCSVPCNAIRKLAGLIDNLSPRKRDEHVRRRHLDLRLLSAWAFPEFLNRPWAYDAGPPTL